MTDKIRSIVRWVIVGSIALFVVLAIPQDTFAAGLIPEPTGKCPEDYMNPGQITPLSQSCLNGEDRDYRLEDFKSLLAIIGNFMLGISGSIALLCFVLGGFFWISSAGNQKLVEKGKSLISGAVVGTIIIFVAYTAVTFVVRIISGTNDYAPESVGVTDSVANSGAPSAKQAAITSINAKFNGSNTVCQDVFKGTCTPVGGCKSSYVITNGCPHTNGVASCCVGVAEATQKTSCGRAGGTCIETKTDADKQKCGGAIVKGLCDGKGMGATVQCCFAGDSGSADTAAPTPQSKCEQVGGTCNELSAGCANGSFGQGLCPGATTRCCLPNKKDPLVANKCSNVGGKCTTDKTCANGQFAAGLCGSGSSVCCVPNASN